MAKRAVKTGKVTILPTFRMENPKTKEVCVVNESQIHALKLRGLVLLCSADGPKEARRINVDSPKKPEATKGNWAGWKKPELQEVAEEKSVEDYKTLTVPQLKAALDAAGVNPEEYDEEE